MRMAVPVAYGGPEADPLTMLSAIETVARADGAAGWCTMIASTTSSQCLFLPPDSARAIYSDPAVVTGGVFAPNGEGAVVDDRVTVSGRWPWGSGTQHCEWVLGGTKCDDDTFRLCWFEAADVTFHDTWYTSGLRGTGSLDFSVDGVSVPLDRTIQPGRSRPTIDIPLAHFPNFSLLAAGVASVSLGIARRAIDELIALAEGKRPQFSSKTLAESAYTQVELARAEAALRVGAGVPPRRGRPGVGPCRRRRAGRRRRPHRDPPGRRQRGAARRRGRRHRLHARRRVERVQLERVAALPARRPRAHPAPPGRAEAPRDRRPLPPRPGDRHVDVVGPSECWRPSECPVCGRRTPDTRMVRAPGPRASGGPTASRAAARRGRSR